MAKIVLLYILPLALMVYAVIDCAADDDVERFAVPKVLWILLIILLPYFGPLGWLAASKIAKPRNRPPGGGIRPRRPGPLAPDDNPQFLRQLAEEQARRERERRRRERREGGGDAPAGNSG
ncbi:MAG: PLDc N-terminal domain-containing protein [Bifidobacteriaceae bacterium]|jgi:hypothetical protein|nr:PLDc N-terminal domain-containing protein [Bifidobacteriaceae bacterium]